MEDSRRTKAQLISEIAELRKRVAELEVLEVKQRLMSITDDLTGLFNRRGFFSIAPKQLTLCCRHNRDAVLLYADIDRLKAINDTLGHVEGDNAIRDVSQVLVNAFRESDIVARVGGDEFIVLMPMTSELEVQNIIARLKKHVAENRGLKRKYSLSISIGHAHYDSQKPCTIDDLISQADEEMYKCKNTQS